MDRVLTAVAKGSRGIATLFLLTAGVGALLRYPGLNLFSEPDEVASWLRIGGGVLAIGTGVLSLAPWPRVAPNAPIVFLQFLYVASIFGVVIKRSPFAKALLLALFVAWLFEVLRQSRQPLESAPPSIQPDAAAAN